MKHLLILFITLLNLKNYGQSNFYIIKDLELNSSAYQLIEHKGKIYISGVKICESSLNDCSFIGEINYNGSFNWFNQLEILDIGHTTMVVRNDTISMAGNVLNKDKWILCHINKNNGEILSSFEIKDNSNLFDRMFIQTLNKLGNKYLLCGQGKRGDGRTSLLYFANNKGKLDTLIAHETEKVTSVVWDVLIGKDSLVTVFYHLENGQFLSDYHKIIKFDSHFNQVWSYTSDTLRRNDSYPKGCELPDDRIVFVYGNPYSRGKLNSIRCIKKDKSISWQHDYPYDNKTGRIIRRLIVAKNGDIIGCGEYADLKTETFIYGSPFIFRLNNKGKMLWERAYVEVAADGKDKTGNLWDIIELDNGDLMAAGHVKNENWDILIIRTDSDGCIDLEDTCQEINIIDITSGSEDVSEEKNDLNIYPNPSSDHITIETSQPCKIDVYDITGHKVLTTGKFENTTHVDIVHLKNGLYIVKCTTKSGVASVQKFIKQ